MFIRLFHTISYRSSNEIEPYHDEQGPVKEPFVGVMTPPMVGSTWPRVCSTLELDCLPALSQGTVLLRLIVD